MRAGKRFSLAAGAAAFIIISGLVHSGEAGGVPYDGAVSIRKNALVKIGGEMLLDLRHIRSTTPAAEPERKSGATDFTLGTATLRIAADVHPHVEALFKINLNPDPESSHDREILEEALVVMKSVCGTGIDFFTGMGRAPYGQDVTLGMIQSYHHAANRDMSPEGTIFIADPPGDAPGAGGTPPAMRPGQLDRSVMMGAAYQWDERWRFEAAVFRPDHSNYSPRLKDRDRWDRGGFDSDAGASARLWFSPAEGLVMVASGMWLRSADMGAARLRADLPASATPKKDAFAASVGFDWRREPWMVFGEYEHGWDWNFTKGYETDTWQLGAARAFGRWRLGTMGEAMRINDGGGRKTVDEYCKVSLNLRYEFSSAIFILAEYGREWIRRNREGEGVEKSRGDFFGVRLGFSF